MPALFLATQEYVPLFILVTFVKISSLRVLPFPMKEVMILTFDTVFRTALPLKLQDTSLEGSALTVHTKDALLFAGMETNIEDGDTLGRQANSVRLRTSIR